MPDEFAVGGIEERNPQAVPIARAIRRTCCIAFGLFEDVLRIDRDFLGFNDAEQDTVHEQGLVRRTILGGILDDSVRGEFGNIQVRPPGNDLPSRVERAQLGINPLSSGLPFGLVHHFQ